MPSNNPLWYCHECRAEMRPLFVPDAHCASCNSTFVEQIDPSDDPRNQPQLPNVGGSDSEDGSPEPIFRLLQAMIGSRPPGARSNNNDTNQRPTSDNSTSPPSQPSPPRLGGSSSFSIELRSGAPGTSRRIVFGRPPTSERSGPLRMEDDAFGRNFLEFIRTRTNDSRPQQDRPQERSDGSPMTLNEYVQSRSNSRDQEGQPQRDPFDNPMLVQQYLLSMLGFPTQILHGGSVEGGRMGDYVLTQDALEQIMNQLMESGHKPVPLPEKDIDDLPRGVLDVDSPILGTDCQVCQDTFEVPKPDEDLKEPGMLTTVTLPCKHSFHEDCIVPWLKQSGTCPVCRHALIAQPTPPQPPGGAGPSGPASSSPDDHNSGSAANFFGGLFNFSSGTGGNSNSSNAPNQNSGSQSRSDQSHVPGAWNVD